MAACGAHVSPGHGSTPTAAAAVADCTTCYTPQQLRVAYGIQPLLGRGVTGRGQTVVLLEFPPGAGSAATVTGASQVPAVTDIRQDLARFDGRFSLPAASLQVVNSLAHTASPWLATPEEVADTEIVHAIAPGAAIREVLIPSSGTASAGTVIAALVAALRLGLTQGGVISLSADAGEQCFAPAAAAQVNSVLQAAQRQRVTVAVSSGDSGAAADPCPGAAAAPVKGVNLPASDPLVLAVGGSSLQASRATDAYLAETAWNTSPEASGGGFSKLFPRPAYQEGTTATRGVPDVAADADPGAGMALAFSTGGAGYVLTQAGGTSVATPLWAAVIALADQYAGQDLGFVNPALYQIGRSASYHQAFHDITTGNNTVQGIAGYQAAPGWDPVTGWGSPDAQVLVPLLARYANEPGRQVSRPGAGTASAPPAGTPRPPAS
jgi:subtilase family serine protease